MRMVHAPSLEYIPLRNRAPRIFLAGSIEMGKAENWQQTFADAFADEHVVLVNPRRKDWDSSWEQRSHNPQFREQVNWELDAILSLTDLVVMHFVPDTMSPITLLELGLCVQARRPLIVSCPDGFWRKGNVEIICERYDVTLVESLPKLIAATKEFIHVPF